MNNQECVQLFLYKTKDSGEYCLIQQTIKKFKNIKILFFFINYNK